MFRLGETRSTHCPVEGHGHTVSGRMHSVDATHAAIERAEIGCRFGWGRIEVPTVRPEGFEPPTHGLEGSCSIH
jgi:hypothetical protein